MGSHTNGPDSGSAAAMRNAKGLVQIQMGYVRPEFARLSKSDESIEIGAIDIHLTTSVMNHRADVGDRSLEHTMS